MLSEAHDLVHELPDHKETIHTLKGQDAHFAKLFGEYDIVNKDVLRIEKGIEIASETHLETLKKKRLALKDQMMKIIEKFEE